jgi:hypothetical protein
MPILTSKDEFITYIKQELGSPVVNVEVADIQFNNIIDDTIQDFQRYSYSEGSYLDYVVFQATANTSAYSLSGMDIADVINVYMPTGLYGINTLFSAEHILLQERGGGPGSGPMSNQMGFRTGSVGLELSEFDISMQYLEEVKRHFGKEYTAQYLRGRQELRIFPTPLEDVVGLLTVYKNETLLNLINNSLVKKLAVARSKVRLGSHLRKFIVALPGGGSVNGDAILQEGKQDEKEIMEIIRLESYPVDMFIS